MQGRQEHPQLVSVGGLASGLDTQGIVNQLLELERRPIAQLEQEVAQLSASQGRYTGLSPSVDGLRAAAQAITDRSVLDRPRVSGGGDGIQVSADADAQEGAYDLVVDRLAQAGRRGSQGFDAEEGIAAGPGTFEVRAGASGAVISVAVDATTTLQDLANAINAQDGEVSAAVINDGSGFRESRLVLTSSRTGRAFDVDVVQNDTNLDFENTSIEEVFASEDNDSAYTGTVTSSGTYTGTESKTFIVEIMTGGASGVATYRVSNDGGQTFDDNGGSGYTTSAAAAALGVEGEGVQIAFSDSGTLTAGDRFTIDATSPVLQEAQDAVFTLNGIQQTRDSNSVNDAVEGLSITLTDADPDATLRFSVSRDDGAIIDGVRGLVEAYNQVFSTIREQQTFDASSNTAGPLLGDRTANAILAEIRRSLTRPADNVSGSVRRLIDLGVGSNAETGQLTLNEARLSELLREDREGVLSVLASNATGSVPELEVSSRPASVPSGDYAVSITTAAERASVTAGGAFTSLAADELLTFEFSNDQTSDAPSTEVFTVQLSAGSTPAQVVQQLNSRFSTQGAGLVASQDGGVLTIEASDFGGDSFFSVRSDTAAGATSSQFGTTLQSDTGVDVAGTIDGVVASGRGATLTAESGTAEGLTIQYTGSSVGLVGVAQLTSGIGDLFVDSTERISRGEGSIISIRNASIQNQIERLEDQIRRKNQQVARTEERLQREFANLEVTLAQLQSQETFLSNQLAQLAPQ